MRLREHWPQVDHYEEQAKPVLGYWAERHRRYITDVSSEVMAASLESAAFLQVFCDWAEPSRVADLGSGFSSWLLREWAAAHDAVVWSVDDDAEWLERTRHLLEENGLETRHMELWSQFVSANPGAFDLVFHDAGSMEFRLENLPRVCELVREGGWLIIDDVHKPTYRRGVQEFFETRDVEVFSLRSCTLDRLTRYAYLIRC